MASQAVSAFGTIITLDGLAIAEVKSISGPTQKADQIDVTSHSSVGAYREFIPSFIDPGELTFDILWVPADPSHDETTGLLAAFRGRVRHDFTLVFPTSPVATWTFEGSVIGFQISAPIDNALTAGITVKVSGAIS